MTEVSASSPGKILLCGEYVVLDGAPSLCAAVNRRAHVTIRESGSNTHVVSSPGFADGTYSFSVDESGDFEWHSEADALPDFSLFECTWAAMNPTPLKPIELVLDTAAFVDAGSGRKLGLGGSAALTVALSAAIGGLRQQAVEVDRMIEMHSQFQGGHGSGVDVAAAYSGGLIDYQRGSATAIKPLPWRHDLKFAVLWSGRSTNTAQKILQFAAGNSESRRREALGFASAAIVSAWRKSSAEEIVDLFAQYTNILIEFSDDYGLGIFDAGHKAMVELAKSYAVVYKPCGAGGGDVGAALSLDKEAIDRFATSAAAMGFEKLDLSIDDNGLAVGNES